MTLKEDLQMLLQTSVQLYGEDAPVKLSLKRQLQEIEEQSSAAAQALRENRWAASIIEVRRVRVSFRPGPYGIVRHPMYSGGGLMILATPLALGSLWAFVCAVLLCGIIAARLLDEERYLSRNLLGYEGYCRKVRYRLIPHVW